jgi:predicted nucleotidyltransferase
LSRWGRRFRLPTLTGSGLSIASLCYEDLARDSFIVETEVPPDAIIERVLSAGQPDKIVLFGSRSRNTTHPQSDYDLLIVQPSDLPRSARAGAYYRALSDLPVEVDILVVTPEEIRDWERVPQAFITTALREGGTLYEKASLT